MNIVAVYESSLISLETNHYGWCIKNNIKEQWRSQDQNIMFGLECAFLYLKLSYAYCARIYYITLENRHKVGSG